MAIESQGIQFFWSTSTNLSTAQKVGEVKGINGPTGSAAVIDVTNFDSTAKEKIMGLPDEGQVTLDLNFAATDAGQTALRNDRATRTRRRALIDFSDASSNYATFEGYVTGFAITGSVDQVVSASVTIEITGPVTYSTR